LPNAAAKRGVISGEAIQWTEEAETHHGRVTIEVSSSSVLNCTISYKGSAQSHLWLVDPERVQNPRRAVYETFDPRLESLTTILTNAQARGQDARDLEAALSWLFWMLGFGVAHLGGTRRTRDAADLILHTQEGHFAVVECTTGLLKAESKLSLLHARSEAVRRSLAASNNSFSRVMPVMVTSRTATEIAPDIEAAERLGILVVTRERFEELIIRTLMRPNVDQIYAESERAVSAALAKYQSPAAGL